MCFKKYNKLVGFNVPWQADINIIITMLLIADIEIQMCVSTP